jgi:hypothetical protein
LQDLPDLLDLRLDRVALFDQALAGALQLQLNLPESVRGYGRGDTAPGMPGLAAGPASFTNAMHRVQVSPQMSRHSEHAATVNTLQLLRSDHAVFLSPWFSSANTMRL